MIRTFYLIHLVPNVDKPSDGLREHPCLVYYVGLLKMETNLKMGTVYTMELSLGGELWSGVLEWSATQTLILALNI